MADVKETVDALAASIPRDCIIEATADEIDDMLHLSDGELREDIENAIRQAKYYLDDNSAIETYVLIRIKADDAPEADAAS